MKQTCVLIIYQYVDMTLRKSLEWFTLSYNTCTPAMSQQCEQAVGFLTSSIPLQKWHTARTYMPLIKRLKVRTSSVLFHLTSQSLSECHQLAPASAANWFIKGRAMCHHVLYDNACKRSLAIFHKSRAPCLIIRILSVPI